ncbi:hypothetical protein BaRGS_00035098 [Batillaria attramentaria]|uniref:Uncharacterized protein n=1 Tax=Batillaria attramentaria TaxID=370345 RepID=A0ABD0JGG6_9CAEN
MGGKSLVGVKIPPHYLINSVFIRLMRVTGQLPDLSTKSPAAAFATKVLHTDHHSPRVTDRLTSEDMPDSLASGRSSELITLT